MIAAFKDALIAIKTRNVWVLSLTLGVVLASYETWLPVLPVHLRNLGATDMQVGKAYSLIAFSYALFQFLGGILADKFGRKTIIIFPMFFTAPIYIIASQVTNWKLLVLLLVLSNLLSAFQQSAFIGLLAESVEEKLRGSAFAIFEIAIALAIAGGTFAGYKLYSTLGVSNLIIFTGIFTLLGAIARIFGLKETMTIKNRDYCKPVLPALKEINPGLWWCFLGMIGFALLSSISLNGPFITLHVKDHFGIPEKYVNLLFFTAGVAAVITAPFSGWLTDRIGPKIVFMIGGFGHGLLLIPWMMSGLFLAGLPFVFCAAASLQAGAIAKNALVSKLTPSSYRTSFIGLIGTIAGLIASAGPTIGMKLKAEFGPYAPFWFAFLVSILIVVALSPIKTNPQNQ